MIWLVVQKGRDKDEKQRIQAEENAGGELSTMQVMKAVSLVNIKYGYESIPAPPGQARQPEYATFQNPNPIPDTSYLIPNTWYTYMHLISDI